MSYLLLLASAGFGVVAYVLYFKEILDSDITPNKWSWLVWSVTTLVEAMTYYEVSCDKFKATVFFISSACCIVVTSLVWSRSSWNKLRLSEAVCVVASLVAIMTWLGFHLTLWAHLLTVAALPVAFWPTLECAWKNYASEDSPSWLLWTVGDFFAGGLIFLRLEKPEELPYVIIEAICHGAVWGVVAYKRHKALSLQS